MTKILNFTLLATASLLAAGVAHAQAAPLPVPDATPAPAAASDAGGDIIVTAQRRSERLKDVPLTVSVVSGQALAAAGVNELRDLATVTSGLVMGRTGSDVEPVIRGVGSAVTEPGADTNVAIYIDGVVQPVPSTNAVELNNIDRIEVLKGPQGSLYGRNATGGAISIVTRTPSFDPHLELTAGYGSFNEARGEAYATGGLTDKIAADLAVVYRDDTGYIKNIANGDELGKNRVFSLRSKVLFKPTDDFTFVASYAHMRRFDSQALTYHVRDGNTVTKTFDPAVDIETNPRVVNDNVDPFVTSGSDQFAGNATWHMNDSVTLNSITSYGKYRSRAFEDADATPVNYQIIDFPSNSKIFNQDLNVNAQLTDKLNLLAGVSYYHGHSFQHVLVYVFSTTTPFYSLAAYNHTNSIAGFAELTYHLTDKLTLIGGLRYTHDRLHTAGMDVFGQHEDLPARFHGVSPRASVRYALSDTTNVYATYSRGFKSGLIDINSFNPNPVKPEINDLVEVGIKHASGMLSFNLAGYRYWYRNIQVESFTGLSEVQVNNATRANIYGVDADVTVKLDSNWRASADFGYNHSRFGAYPNASYTMPLPGGGNAQLSENLYGTRLPRVPDYTASGTITYSHPLAGGGVEVSATGSYTGSIAWDAANRLIEPSYFLLSGRIQWVSPSGQYKLGVWGENLTNKVYSQQTQDSQLGDLILYAKPRRIGVTVTTEF